MNWDITVTFFILFGCQQVNIELELFLLMGSDIYQILWKIEKKRKSGLQRS